MCKYASLPDVHFVKEVKSKETREIKRAMLKCAFSLAAHMSNSPMQTVVCPAECQKSVLIIIVPPPMYNVAPIYSVSG